MRTQLRGLTLFFVLFGASVGACANGNELVEADDDEEIAVDGAVRPAGRDAGRDARAASSSSSGRSGSGSSSGDEESSSSSSGGGSSSSGGGSSGGSSSGGSSSGGSSSGGSSSGGSSSGGSSSGGSSSGGTAASCEDGLVINEVQLAAASGSGAAATEFVEIYNPGDCAADFGLLKLEYRSASNNAGSAGFTGAITIAAGGYAVLGSADYVGTTQGTLVSGLAAASGQLGIVRKTNRALIDGVAWGSVATGMYKEGATCTASAGGQSMARTPNGADTDNNQADFGVDATPTPGAAN